MSVRTVLWASGLLTLIAVGIPQSVTLGLYLLVVPGFILALAPTVFLYTATFVIVRRLLPITHAVALNIVAAFIAVGLGVLVALPVSVAGRWAFHRAATGDVAARDRVVIGGDVLLNNNLTPTQNIAGKSSVPCDALCAALLDTPGVGTVTIAGTNSSGDPVTPTSYRLVPKGQAVSNGMAPTSPEKIWEYLPGRPVFGSQRTYEAEMAMREAYKAQQNAIIARWGMRLASEVTLVMVPSPAHHDLTITIAYPIKQGSHAVTVKQAEVRDREGRVLLRRQHVTAAVVFAPLLLMPYDMPNSTKWGMARSEIETSDRLGDIKPIAILFDETTLSRPSELADAAASMRDRLAAALMQPGEPADLSLAGPWLATINWHSITDGDIELLGKLIADARVIDLPHLYENAGTSIHAELRGAIVARMLNPATSPQLRKRLDVLLRFMPPGTFAVSTSDEMALLRDQPLRLNAPGLVQRLADQGKAGVPELVRILQEDASVEPWGRREGIVKAIRRAVTRLGPDAAPALPAVIELFDQPDPPLAHLSNEMDEWRVAMVLMGRPIEDVPFSPIHTAEQTARLRSQLMRSAEHARDHPELSR